MNIYWDTQNHVLLESTSSGQQIQTVEWYLRDLVDITLYIVQPKSDDQGYDQQEAPSGWTPKLGVKHEDSLAGGFLAYQGSWPKSGSGANATYGATLNLNTSELIADFNSSASNNERSLILEFTLQDASGHHRDTTQVALTITGDVIRGTEGSAPTALENWPWIEEFTDPATGKKCLRIQNSDGETCDVLKPQGV